MSQSKYREFTIMNTLIQSAAVIRVYDSFTNKMAIDFLGFFKWSDAHRYSNETFECIFRHGINAIMALNRIETNHLPSVIESAEIEGYYKLDGSEGIELVSITRRVPKYLDFKLEHTL